MSLSNFWLLLCSVLVYHRYTIANIGLCFIGNELNIFQPPNERRVQSRSTPFVAKPGSLWTCGPAPSPAATPRVCHQPPDCTRKSPHSSAHPGTLWS